MKLIKLSLEVFFFNTLLFKRCPQWRSDFRNKTVKLWSCCCVFRGRRLQSAVRDAELHLQQITRLSFSCFLFFLSRVLPLLLVVAFLHGSVFPQVVKRLQLSGHKLPSSDHRLDLLRVLNRLVFCERRPQTVPEVVGTFGILPSEVEELWRTGTPARYLQLSDWSIRFSSCAPFRMISNQLFF